MPSQNESIITENKYAIQEGLEKVGIRKYAGIAYNINFSLRKLQLLTHVINFNTRPRLASYYLY